MTELFDPSPYGPGKATRTRKPPEEGVTVTNHGQWHLITRVKKEPYPLAHRLVEKIIWKDKRWEGGWTTRCGLRGPAIELPEGPVQACPVCKDRSTG